MRVRKYSIAAWLSLIGVLCAYNAPAQTVSVSENFDSATTTNNWYALGDACLTASSTASGTATATVAGSPPGCTAISSTYGENLVGGYRGVAGSAQTLPDPTGYGALRFTNGCIYTSSASNCTNGGHNQNGAIISGLSYSSTAGIQITFKTTTYRGDSYNGSGGDSDGADGMSFFLIDGSVTPNIGSFGGSLGYSCANNKIVGGMIGAYIGLGIDEYGNFLNGTSNTFGTSASASGDNTATGGGYVPNRIGMRGAGNVNWTWLLANYPTYYNNTTYTSSSPTSTQISNEQEVVEHTCANGYLSDYNGNSINGTWTQNRNGNWVNSGTTTTLGVADYAAIPNAWKTLTNVTIADEYANGGYARPNGLATGTTGAVPGSVMTYKLIITPAGLLSLSYSVNGGSWSGVLANQSILASNGTMPNTIRFGFAGSTGGGSNIHEVMCFKAASLDSAGSSAGSNLQQSAKITTGTQAYFAYYNPNNWSGDLTAYTLGVSSTGVISISSAANWDASCVLTGVANLSPQTVNSSGTPICPTTGLTTPTSAEGPTSRVILSWSNATPAATTGAGVPFEWTSSGLSSTQQATLDAGDSTATAYRLNYLRGDRTQEVTTTGSGLYRDRGSVLADIVDSSPTPVGQPSSPYGFTWQDKLVSTDTIVENSGQKYSAFYTAEQTRQNMVYVGANDGLLHGFRAGAYSTSNSYVATTNDGSELIAYMPAAVVNTIHNSSTVELDYSNTQYGHNFYVDATPGTGDLYYGNAWHTWLVGGLGAGGAAIYALDVTDPTGAATGTTAFSEANASSLVMGEWSASNITCSNATNCANSLGNTYGTPVIRRLHNGNWAVIFGNGFGSISGDAGIYVAIVNPPSAPVFYYLSTSTGTGTTASPCTSSCNGIAYVTPVDLDGDNITDYVYAGDLLGNVWRFDLTSGTPGSWAAGSAPLFSAGSSQPITSSVLVAMANGAPGTQVMVAFGTGRQIPLTNSSATSYASGTQALYAVWDWNFTSWNAKSTVQYASLNSSSTGFATSTGLSSPYTIKPANLTADTLTENAGNNGATVDITSSTICWAGTTTCTTTNQSFGWYASLPGTSEQIIYNPELVAGAFVVNSVIPATTNALSCTSSNNTGYTYAILLYTGSVSTTTISGTPTNFFSSAGDSGAVGSLTNATGTSLVVTANANGTVGCTAANCTPQQDIIPNSRPFPNVTSCGADGATATHALVGQTSSGTATVTPTALKCPLSGARVTWTRKR